MRERTVVLLPLALAAALALLVTLPLTGMAGSAAAPTIAVVPPAAGAGAIVEVSGAGFPRDTTVIVELATTTGPIPLATVATTRDGAFRDAITLPERVPAGELGLIARAADGSAASHAFGAAMPLIEASGAEAAAVDADVRGGNADGFVLVFLGLMLGVLATGALFAWQSLHEDRHQPGMGSGDDLIWGAGEAMVEPELTATDEPFWKRAEAPASEPGDPLDQEAPSTGEHEAPASA